MSFFRIFEPVGMDNVSEGQLGFTRFRWFRENRVCIKPISSVISRDQRCPTEFRSFFRGVQPRILAGKDRYHLQEGDRDHGSFYVPVLSDSFCVPVPSDSVVSLRFTTGC